MRAVQQLPCRRQTTPDRGLQTSRGQATKLGSSKRAVPGGKGAKGRPRGSAGGGGPAFMAGSECLGADDLLQLLKNYARNSGLKTAITVGTCAALCGGGPCPQQWQAAYAATILARCPYCAPPPCLC